MNWVLDADIRDFFGRLDRAWLRKFCEHRIADPRILRLIDKWLAAGVIEDGQWVLIVRSATIRTRPAAIRRNGEGRT